MEVFEGRFVDLFQTFRSAEGENLFVLTEGPDGKTEEKSEEKCKFFHSVMQDLSIGGFQ